MSITYIQANEGYVDGVSMAVSGCGPCSVASVASNIKRTTPTEVAAWLHARGAFSSAGTTRAGITVALDHYGFKSTYYTPEHAGGTVWKNALNKMKSLTGDWWAIFLVVGTKNGGKDNLWTSGGHYLAITDYKNGKLYVRDSGAKKRTGYYDTELLRYDTNCIWIIQKKSNAATYSGTFPTLPAKGYLGLKDTGTQVKYLQLFLKWYGVYKGSVDSSFGEETKKAVAAYQSKEGLKKDNMFGPACLARAKTVKK